MIEVKTMKIKVSIQDVNPDNYPDIVNLDDACEAIVYANKRKAEEDQTILGSSWEIADDLNEAYAHIGPFPSIYHMFAALRADGYIPEEV